MSGSDGGCSSDSTEDLSADDEDRSARRSARSGADAVVASAVAGGGCLVFKPDDVVRLRSKHRLIGRLIGTVPPDRPAKKTCRRGADANPESAPGSPAAPPADNLFQKSRHKSGAGLPLFLSAAETAVAVAEKLVEFIPPDDGAVTGASACRKASLQPPPLLYDLWRRGFYVTAATKFGGEWLCYQDDPICVHADYIVSHWPMSATATRSSDNLSAGASRVDVAAALRAIGINVSVQRMRPIGSTVSGASLSFPSPAGALGTTPAGQESQRSPADASDLALLHKKLHVGAELVALLRLAIQAKKTLILAVERQENQDRKFIEDTQTGFTYYRLTRR